MGHGMEKPEQSCQFRQPAADEISAADVGQLVQEDLFELLGTEFPIESQESKDTLEPSNNG